MKCFNRVARVQCLIHFAVSCLSCSCGFETSQRSQPWYVALFLWWKWHRWKCLLAPPPSIESGAGGLSWALKPHSQQRPPGPNCTLASRGWWHRPLYINKQDWDELRGAKLPLLSAPPAPFYCEPFPGLGAPHTLCRTQEDPWGQEDLGETSPHPLHTPWRGPCLTLIKGKCPMEGLVPVERCHTWRHVDYSSCLGISVVTCLTNTKPWLCPGSALSILQKVTEVILEATEFRGKYYDHLHWLLFSH